MVIIFSIILLGLLFLIKPLQRNIYYLLHIALVILSAYYVEHHYFRLSPLQIYNPILMYKTFLLFLVFHFVSINIVTIIAYWKDKRSAVRGNWRIPEVQLHTLELLGGWCGAFLAQKIFHHKNKKKGFQAVFWLIFFFQLSVFVIILKYLRII